MKDGFMRRIYFDRGGSDYLNSALLGSTCLREQHQVSSTERRFAYSTQRSRARVANDRVCQENGELEKRQKLQTVSLQGPSYGGAERSKNNGLFIR
jgi:hypothetical protein